MIAPEGPQTPHPIGDFPENCPTPTLKSPTTQPGQHPPRTKHTTKTRERIQSTGTETSLLTIPSEEVTGVGKRLRGG